MKYMFPFFLLVGIGCKQPVQTETLSKFLAKGKVIDLTYSFSNETLYWPNNPTGFK
jgi:hypothetical protein